VAALGLDRVMRAAEAALKEGGLWWLIQQDPIVMRVCGPPGSFDPYLLTEVWADDGFLRAECSVPVVVPRDRLEQVLELCALLNGQGRVGFALGRRGTPIAAVTVALPVSVAEVAQRLCANGFSILWDYAASAEPLFAAVAAGSEPATALEVATEGGPAGPAGPAGFPISWRPPESPKGTRWDAALDGVPVPKAVPVPDGYTEAEARGVFAAFSRLKPGEGVVDACGGPLLIHSDGVVECFGCEAPGVNPHLMGSTVSCAPGLYLGSGHLCERCKAQA
jgi:hypothetical protein